MIEGMNAGHYLLFYERKTTYKTNCFLLEILNQVLDKENHVIYF